VEEASEEKMLVNSDSGRMLDSVIEEESITGYRSCSGQEVVRVTGPDTILVNNCWGAVSVPDKNPGDYL
jgi:D-serine deaminase-like pyridoxal phosphate-dependent protein